jgi:hypothetical protein
MLSAIINLFHLFWLSFPRLLTAARNSPCAIDDTEWRVIAAAVLSHAHVHMDDWR